MVTATYPLPIPPHGFDASAPAGLAYENDVPHILFDDTTPEGIYWKFRMPVGFSSALALKLLCAMASATSGKIEFEGSLWKTTPGSSILTPSYATVNVGSVTVPATAGFLFLVTVTITNDDSVAVGDRVVLKLFRDADDATNDTATGDLKLETASLEYTAS